jgi:hypothetical protein
MKGTLYLILTIIGMSAIGCNNKQKPENTAKGPTVEQSAIPGVPADVIQKLLDECTYIDYIFHTLPFSLSQNEDPSIDQNILFTDFNRPIGKIPAGCKPIARKFFKIGGEFAYDVDVYFTNGCQFYVFVKDNKPLYANYMTQEGINFYNKMISMVNAQTGQTQ